MEMLQLLPRFFEMLYVYCFFSDVGSRWVAWR